MTAGRTLSLLVHGTSKVGKTWFANTAPAPRLFLDAEGGTRFLPGKQVHWDPLKEEPPKDDGTWETCIVYVRDYLTVTQAYQWLVSGKHPFKSVIIDSLSETQQRCVDAIAGTNQMQLQNWGELFRTVATLVRQFRDLTTHPTHPIETVILVAMTRDSDGKKGPYVQGQLAITLPYYIDVIGYIFTQPAEDGTGVLLRRLLVSPQPGFEAGDRTGKLGQVVEGPNVADMLTTIYGSTQETTQEEVGQVT